MRAIITNGGTHHPENWADAILEELVPLKENPSAETLVKVGSARQTLRVPVVAALTAMVEHEKKVLQKITLDREIVAHLAKSYAAQHGGPTHIQLHELHRDTGDLKPAEHWVDRYISEIVKAAMSIEGDKLSHNEMVDSIYRTMSHWAKSVALAERSHAVTSNNFHIEAS